MYAINIIFKLISSSHAVWLKHYVLIYTRLFCHFFLFHVLFEKRENRSNRLPRYQRYTCQCSVKSEVCFLIAIPVFGSSQGSQMYESRCQILQLTTFLTVNILSWKFNIRFPCSWKQRHLPIQAQVQNIVMVMYMFVLQGMNSHLLFFYVVCIRLVFWKRRMLRLLL